MKTNRGFPLCLACIGGGLETQRLTKAWVVYALQLLSEVGYKMFGNQVGAIVWDEVSTDQFSLQW